MHAPAVDSDQWTHRRLAAGGLELHGVSHRPGRPAGDAPLMVLLHGFPEFWFSWRHQLTAFSPTHHVVAPDMRGYNLSDRPTGRRAYRLDRLAEDIDHLLDTLGYERCVLVGHDWGGAVAWEFAHIRPERVDQLVVLNMPHPRRFFEGLASLAQLRRSWYIFLFQLPWLPEQWLGRDNARLVADILAAQTHNPDAFDPGELAAFRRAASRPGALTAMLNYYRSLPAQAAQFSRRQWPILDVPTLMLWGKNDRMLGQELTADTDRLVRHLDIQYIDDCSHWTQQDRPRVVNDAIAAFIS